MEIYFDNSATTIIHPDIQKSVYHNLQKAYGNPSSIHSLVLEANNILDKARNQLSRLVNCSPSEIYFTNSGTFANNLSILGRARFIQANNLGKHIITSAIEHPSILGPIKYLESQGFMVTYLKPDHNGQIQTQTVINALTKNTSIVSIMWANNEIGSLFPIQDLAQKLAQLNIFFHTDAIQVAGKLNIDLEQVQVSTLSLSGHKFHAPKGIGAIFIRKGINLMPIIFGGGQEMGYNPGTHALTNIEALGQASELAKNNLNRYQDNLRQLQNYLINEISQLPNTVLTGPITSDLRLPGHVSFATSLYNAEALVNKASLKGLYLSSGSACKAGIKEPSHVLKCLDLPEDYLNGAIRISLSQFNTMSECQTAIEILKRILLAKDN